MQTMEQDSGSDGVSGRRAWVLTLAAAAAIYAVLMVVVLWDFWPHVGACVLDTRHLACSNYDKIYELERTYPGDFSRAWSIASDYLDGRGVGTEPMAFNLLPTALVGLLALVLPLVTAYNLITIGAWLANGLAACALTFFICRRRVAAVLGGFLFAFSPMAFSTQYCRSLDYELAFPLPILLMLMWGVRARRSLWWPISLGGMLVVLGLINQYYLVGMAALLLAWAAYAWLRPLPAAPRAPTAAAVVTRLALACLAALVVLSPWLLVEVLKLQAEHPLATRLLIHDSPDPPALFWRFDLHHTGWVWSLAAAPLALAALALPSRVSRADRLFLAACAAAVIVTLWFVLPQLRGVMRELPVLWRMREVDKIAALPAMLTALLGGVGWTALTGKLTGRAPRLILHGLVLALCLWSVAQGRQWWSEESARSPSLAIPPQVAATLEGLSPRPLIAALATTDVNEHLPYSFQLSLRYRTGAQMVDPEQAGQLQARLQELLGVRIRGDVKTTGAARRPRREDHVTSRCQVLALFYSPHKPLRPQKAMAQLGYGLVLFSGEGLVVAGNASCK